MSCGWRPVTRAEPCLVCGKSSWCGRSADGCWWLCRRAEGGIPRVDKSGTPYWLYRRDGAKPERPALELPRAVTPQRANLDTLDRVYAALLGSLTISPAHRENLRRRGLPDDEIARRGYRSLPASGRAQLARRLIERFGVEACSSVPGIYLRSQDAQRWWSLAGPAGMLLPVRDQVGRITALMVRRDEGDADPRYLSVSSGRHGGPGPLVGVHVPLHDGDPGDAVRLTEGVLKSDIATCLDDTLTLGLSAGVAGWRQSIPVLQAIQAKTVLIAFAADARRNLCVARALAQAVRALQAAGFTVKIETWDEAHGKGIDDVHAAGHRPEVLQGRDMRQWIRETLRSAWAEHRERVQPCAQGVAAVDDHSATSLPPVPASDPWDGFITVPLRPYGGYRGARYRTGVTRG